MNTFIQQLVNALSYGSLLGFIALGYTMVYGILKLINFAHGHLVTLAIFLIISLLSKFASHSPTTLLLVTVISIILVIIAGIMVELFAYRPLRKAPRLSLIVSALGAAMIIQNAIMLIWGADPKIFPDLTILDGNYNINGIVISHLNLAILGLNVLVMIALYIFINKTRTGIAIKALSIDYTTAQLMGVNVNRIIILVFIIGALLGSVGGVLIGATYKTVSFNMGFNYGLKAFIAAIIGGIGSIPGAMLGGLVIGIAQTLSTGYISSTWGDVFTYSFLILILIIKPSGLFSEKKAEKV